MAAPLTKAKVGTGRSMIAANAAWPARAMARACSRSRHVRDAGQVGADGEDERLAGDADGLDLAGLGAGAQPVDRGLQPRDGLRAEGVGPGVVVPVVERDQREDAGAAGEA